MEQIYEIPESVTQLFSNGESDYKIIDYNAEMDNTQALRHFLDCIGATDYHIEQDNGTEVILRCEDYPQLMAVSSTGLGDFFSHAFEVTEYNFG